MSEKAPSIPQRKTRVALTVFMAGYICVYAASTVWAMGYQRQRNSVIAASATCNFDVKTLLQQHGKGRDQKPGWWLSVDPSRSSTMA
jgi:hypothetical protein